MEDLQYRIQLLLSMISFLINFRGRKPDYCMMPAWLQSIQNGAGDAYSAAGQNAASPTAADAEVSEHDESPRDLSPRLKQDQLQHGDQAAVDSDDRCRTLDDRDERSAQHTDFESERTGKYTTSH
jgi:hypothetical protein